MKRLQSPERIKNLWEKTRHIERKEKKYISATKIKNYMLDDPIIDWLELYYTHNKKETENSNLLFEKGNDFEDKILTNLKEKFKDEMITIAKNNISDLNNEKYLQTIDEMKKGTPIIAQAVLINDNNYTWGIADLLVRSDYLNKLVKYKCIYDDEINIKGENLNGDYHYRVIDIKWSTFMLCVNVDNLRNDKRVPAYKGQLAIYNMAIGEIQGYFPNQAYIMAKQWKLESKQFNGVFGWDDRLGIVDYSDFDNKYIEKTYKAILWHDKLLSEGSKWDLYNPVEFEMYPNLNNQNDLCWNDVKREISSKIHELTSIWRVNLTNRNYAHKQNIYKWSDPRCNAESLNIKGSVYPRVIDKILEVNRDSDKIILPEKIENNMFKWQQKGSLDFYMDFETITNVLYEDVDIDKECISNEIIFMVGIGYEIDDNFMYTSFICNELTSEEEDRILTKCFEHIDEVTYNYGETEDPIRIFHWSSAEQIMLERAEKRHNNKWIEKENLFLWVDMCKIFTLEPIVVKGAFNFKLKEIAINMSKQKLIDIEWPVGGPNNGLDAMMDAVKYYNSSNRKNNIIISIEEYNKIDCMAVWKIVDYLRKTI